MAQGTGGGEAVTIQEMVLTQMFQSKALLNVLERKGVVTKAEVVQEVKRLREKSAKAR